MSGGRARPRSFEPPRGRGRHGRRPTGRDADPGHRRSSGGRGPRSGLEHRRLIALVVGTSLVFLAIAVRVVSLQVLEPDQLVAFGESQRTRVTTVPAPRGTILDRNGDELALSVPSTTITVDPRRVDDPVATALALAPVLRTDAASIQESLVDDGSFAYVQRQVPTDVGAAVEDLGLPGISLITEPTRDNPAGELARSLVGRVDVDQVGISGLEEQYDDVLAGSPGEVVVERDPQGNTIASGHNHYDDADQGQDVILTIDREVQYEAERLLADQVAATGARGGTVIVSRPRTGELLAVANVDAYDEETSTFVAPVSGTENRAVTAVFEPGSVNKVITLSAALQEGVVTPDTTAMVPYGLQIGDHWFTDAHEHPTEPMTTREVLTQSSNIGTIQIAQQVGAETIDHYLRAFGFGRPTDLGFPSEAAGIVLPPEEWSATSIGTIPIGQGVAVTPLQILMAFNVIANGGRYVAPQLVSAVVDADGDRQDAPEPHRHRVISEATAAQMTSMMTGVVEEGTGVAAAVEGYPVAGKTGTARKPQPNGTYQDEAGNYHYMATFAGFVPANDPQLSIIVVLDEPQGDIYGGGVAAPVFSRLAGSILRAYRIPPPVSLAPVDAAG
jgi:cell division protein FtsI (penicillin-binding protein 3)